uniref:Uncharacterized protein n=1 Tax=Eiseniibacteriota bacterium TaxID=2212470 RepID=A0A832I2Y0_UNCEI
MTPKYRRKPIVVRAVRLEDGNMLVETPWSDQQMTLQQFRREYEPTDPKSLTGCSCSLPHLVMHEPAPGAHLEHAPNCPLANY